MRRTRAARRCTHVVLGLALILVAAGAASAQGTTGTSIGDWSDVRGTNYVPTTAWARDNIRMWLSPGPRIGVFDRHVVDQELGELRRFDLNSIRLFGSFYAWVADRGRYLHNLQCLLASCRRHGLHVTFIPWDTFGADGLESSLLVDDAQPTRTIDALLSQWMSLLQRQQNTLPPGWGGMWFASPGNGFLTRYREPKLWHATVKARADLYLDDVARLLGGPFKDVFLSYDVINEPDNLIFLNRISQDEMLRVTSKLSAYTMRRIWKLHPGAKFTVGTVQAVLGLLLNRKLKAEENMSLDYLSYHDYLTGVGFDKRALQAAALGYLENLEVVCSEFFTAARQGHLRHLLSDLQRFNIGGQMWSAIEDRIFVLRYDDAMQRVFPSTPRRWWVHDSGVLRPELDPAGRTGWRYEVKNQDFADALRAWAGGRLSTSAPWPELHVRRHSQPRDPFVYEIKVTGSVGRPAFLLVAFTTAARIPFPGFGVGILSGNGVRPVFLGYLAPTEQPRVGSLSFKTRLPGVIESKNLVLQAVVGQDYNLPRWEKSSRTLATPIIKL